MVKKILAMLIIYFASGALLYLDFKNELVLNSTEQLQHDLASARSEANRRTEYSRAEIERKIKARELFENQALISLNRCQVAAEKSKNDFNFLVEKELSGQPDYSIIRQAFAFQLGRLNAAAYAECQRVYDNLILKGS